MKKKITFTTIIQQLKFDLIGKDSQRGITLTYGWLANQFGHFALGFIPTQLFYLVYTHQVPVTRPLLWAPLTTMFMWTSFEAYNFLSPLWKPAHTNPFKPDWINVGFDTVSDVLFFYTGAIFGILLYSLAPAYCVVALILFCITIILFAYWYPIKMYTQYAYFPFQTRLSQWNFPISQQNIERINQLILETTPKHILLFGKHNSGKTALAVSIGTEKTIQKNTCFYTTCIKFLELLETSDEDFCKKMNVSWSWRETEYLIIDDINSDVTDAALPEIISPEYISRIIAQSAFKQLNIEVLKTTTIVWVIGKGEYKQEWINFIQSYGVALNDIICIELAMH
jgi:hypothetical protein